MSPEEGPVLRWAALEVGVDVELARRTYGTLELFLFSAAGWNPHRIHYDHHYATAVEGHAAVVVQGPLQAAHAVGALLDALDVAVAVRTLAYRHRAPLLVGQEMRITARPERVEAGGSAATFEVSVERVDDAMRTTTVTATVEPTA